MDRAMRDRKKVNSDFIAWDDQTLDLDDLLGNYTATDDNWESDNSSDNDLVVNEVVHDSSSSSGSCSESEKENNISPPPPPKKKKAVPKQSSARPHYQCPVCDKLLKTIAGFRGHMQRLHKITDVRASSHRVAPETHSHQKSRPDRKSTADATYTPDKTSPAWDIPDMEAVIKHTMQVIQKSKLRNMASSRSGHFIIEIASQVTFLGAPCVSALATHLGKVVSVLGTGATMQLDRERMYAAFHQMRFNSALLSLMTAEITTAVADHLHLYIRRFIQIFLGELLDAVIEVRITQASEQAATNTEPLSAQTQGVVMYVSGFVVNALMKRYKRSSNTRPHLSAAKQFISTSSSPEYLSQHQGWIKMCDRGGLKLPSDNFFLLLRQMEAVTSANTDLTHLQPDSLLVDKLQEYIQEDFMVSHYWGLLMASVCPLVSLRLLNDTVDLFLKVRGRAVENLVKRGMALSRKEKSMSLRKTLKR